MKVGDKVEFKSWEECRILDAKHGGPGGFITERSMFRDQLEAGGVVLHIESEYRFTLEGDTCNFTFDPRWIKNHQGETLGIPLVKNQLETYTFRDEDADIRQICNDAFEDGKFSWIVIGEGRCFIGYMDHPVDISEEVLNTVIKEPALGGAYIVAEVRIESVALWVKALGEYTEQVKIRIEERDAFIKDRSRKKVDDNKYKVILF